MKYNQEAYLFVCCVFSSKFKPKTNPPAEAKHRNKLEWPYTEHIVGIPMGTKCAPLDDLFYAAMKKISWILLTMTMNLMLSRLLKVKVGNDQEMAQSEKNPTTKQRWEKQSGTYTKKTYRNVFGW